MRGGDFDCDVVKLEEAFDVSGYEEGNRLQLLWCAPAEDEEQLSLVLQSSLLTLPANLLRKDVHV